MKGMTPITDRAGRFSALKTVTLAALAAPALWLAYRAVTHDLGPLAVKEALLVLGLWAVRLLLVTLVLTPAQRFLNLPRLALVRRMTGVAAFAYAAGHLLLYIVMEKFNLIFVASEIALRHVGRPLPNAALLGGFAAVSGVLALDSVLKAIREKFAGPVGEANVAAAREAYDAARAA